MSTNERDRMTDWKLYDPEAEPAKRKRKLPAPPPWRQSGPARRAAIAATFRAAPEVVHAVNAALHLRRPLLVTGNPGTGKTSLAYSIAQQLHLGEPLVWSINSRSTLADGLYRYDALARLQAIQMRQAAGAVAGADEGAELGSFITLGPLGSALAATDAPRVLLIDEIDKSDVDLPNDLLHVLDTGEFEIPELQRIARSHPTVQVQAAEARQVGVAQGKVAFREFPLIVMTSNGERDFPPAFLRRCVQCVMPDPAGAHLASIVQAHLPDLAQDDALRALLQYFEAGTPEDPFTTQILVQGPGRPPVTATAAGLVYYGAPLIAGDGTVHMTTVVYAAGSPTITEFRVTTLRPGASPVAWTATGAPVGGPTLTGAGDFVLTTATGGGAPDDTQTTVTIIRDGQRSEVLTIAGVTQDQAVIGADGTIALAATNASGGATIGVLRPGAAADYLDLPAALQGAVTVADDGTIVFTTVGVTGFAARAASTTTLWVWRAGEQAVANTAAGTLVQVVTGGGGTVAYVTTTGTGTEDDLITTTVTVLRPGSPDRVSTVVGTLVSSVVAGADGTVAFHTYAGPANAFVADVTVTIMRPNGTVESLTRTTNQIYRIRPAIGPDGTVASMWGNNGMTIAVFRPGQAPIIVTNPNGISIDPRIGSDGTVAFTVGETAPTGEQYSQIVVLRPGQNTVTASTIGNAWGDPTITGDGTVVISTRVDRNLSYITVLRANGDYLIVPAPGLISNAAQVGPDGVIYLPTDVDGTSVNVTIVNTANRYVTLNLPGRASGFSINANGGGTDFVTVSLDASGSVRYIINRVFVATVA